MEGKTNAIASLFCTYFKSDGVFLVKLENSMFSLHLNFVKRHSEAPFNVW